MYFLITYVIYNLKVTLEKEQKGVVMSGSNSIINGGAGATAVTGAVLLPFTGGNAVISLVVVTAIVCALVVLAVKVAKKLIVRGS